MTDLSHTSKRQKLLYRCSKRGTKENELIFRAFADEYLDRLNLEELEELEMLLDCPDHELARWLADPTHMPAVYRTGVFEKVRGTLGSKGPSCQGRRSP